MMGISLRRTLLIARRDFVGYIKTWGFWLSFFLPIIFGGIGVLFGTGAFGSIEPARYEAILDDTGVNRAAIEARAQANFDRQRITALKGFTQYMLSDSDAEVLDEIIKNDGADAALAFAKNKNPEMFERMKMPKNKTIFVDPPAASVEAVKPYLKGDKKIMVDGEEVTLNGLLHIRDADPVEADYWSRQVNANTVKNLAQRYFRDKAEADYLGEKGLSRSDLITIRDTALPVTFFDPSKAVTDNADDQKVSMKDRLPYVVAGAMSLILWFTVFSGSYMLLTSMLEEKLNKLLEMMLATTRFSEIIFGKLLGVAALTITAMLPYIILFVVGIVAFMVAGPPDAAEAISAAFTPKLIIFFIIFLVLGYVFYGALFIALGAMASSMQDAQTLTTPIMLILTASIMVVPHGISSPDSPILAFAAWFPLSAPFASLVRLPSDPPLWELCLSAGFLALLSVGVVMLSGRLFRYGVLSGSGVKGIGAWFKRAVLRQKPKA